MFSSTQNMQLYRWLCAVGKNMRISAVKILIRWQHADALFSALNAALRVRRKGKEKEAGREVLKIPLFKRCASLHNEHDAKLILKSTYFFRETCCHQPAGLTRYQQCQCPIHWWNSFFKMLLSRRKPVNCSSKSGWEKLVDILNQLCIGRPGTQYTSGWPKKVSHYQQSSLNRIKNRHCRYISHQFWVLNEH